MQKRGLGVLIAVASTVALVVAVALAGGSARPADAAGPPAQAVQGQGRTVTPTHFRGDLRRIPGGNVVRSEERPEPRSPNDAPPAAQNGDPVVQGEAAAAPAPSPTSFEGLDYSGFGAGWPPDTNGDVGPAYYIQTVNTSIGVFDKSNGSRVAAFTFDTFFSHADTGTPCDDSNQGDPVVVYDPLGDRWIISDFAWSSFSSGAMYECMAVSASADPVSGGWHFYAWQTSTGGSLPDYPKLGVWPDGIYMTANVFSTTGSGSFQHVQVWAFNRQQMEAGVPAGSVTFSLPRSVGGVSVFSLLPSNMRSVTGAPPAGSPNYLASIWGAYAIRVWKFHVDWASPSSSTLTGPTNVSIATFNVGPGDVPARNGNSIDTLSYRLMMQNQYTNLNGRESLWLTHTVGSGGTPNRAQVRWYELPVTGGQIASSPAQQSTWSPDTRNRFMPSLAVDRSGDMALGYSVSDSTLYPAIRYAGRLAGDPASTLGQSETSLIEGSGSQCCSFSDGSTNSRWGDYSAMTIDPDGCTFWYTNEYYATQPTSLATDDWRTRIGHFKFPSCGTTQAQAPVVSSFSPTSGPPGTAVTISGSNLSGASSVRFNGTSASFTVVSGTQITATVPSGATSGPISVTTAAGTGTSSASFTVTSTASAPTITSFSPTSGKSGTAVTISGSGFTAATSVAFNGRSASFAVVSDTQIQATVPNGAKSGPITVATPGGTATSPGSFTVTKR